MDADVLVIGCGPAGLQAAIHSARSKASTVVVGRMDGSAAYSTKVENYFGVSGTCEGTELLRNGLHQAEGFGAKIVEGNIIAASSSEGRFRVTVENGSEIVAKAVVLATGVSRVKLNVPGEKELYGKGVSYCAVCDCNFYKGKVVAVVGSQSEAAVSAEFMTRYASKVYWVSSSVEADKALVDAAVSAGVEMVRSSVKEIVGDGKVSSISLTDGRSITVDGVFIELGGRSSVDIAMDFGAMPEMDDTLKVGADCSTSVPGLFAAGDITGRPWQIAKAVGQGAVAGMSASSYAKKVSS